jgi:pimeloyl-ACP methyl ester carboxylesterase
MIKKQNYTIAGAGGRLMLADLTFDDTNPQAPIIIFSHGFNGFKDWGAYNLVADYFALHGFRFLKFNFSHNGTTPDQPVDFADLIAYSDNTFSMELDDLGRIIDFACNGTAIPRAASVILMGHSMGGGISIIKAAEDKRVSTLISMAAIASFRNLWSAQDEVQWRLQGIRYFLNGHTGMEMPIKASLLDDLDRNPVRLNVEAKAAEVNIPWLLVHGDADTILPLNHAHQLKAAQTSAKLVVIKKADHVFNVTQPYPSEKLTFELQQFCDESVSFLDKELS